FSEGAGLVHVETQIVEQEVQHLAERPELDRAAIGPHTDRRIELQPIPVPVDTPAAVIGHALNSGRGFGLVNLRSRDAVRRLRRTETTRTRQGYTSQSWQRPHK